MASAVPPVEAEQGGGGGESAMAMGREGEEATAMAGERAEDVPSGVVIEHRAYARVGFLGNPSDVYFGKIISFSLGDFWASVRLQPARKLVIRPHPVHDLVSFDSVDHMVKPLKNEEKELGIVAGLQDRVAQVYGGLVYMDFSKDYMDALGHGKYIPMDTSILPPLHLIYTENPSDSGKAHSTVRKRWLDGDKFIISSMEEVAQIAFEGRSILMGKNYNELAKLMNRNFDLRRQMFRDDVLGSLNIKMIEVARSVGAASKFMGSRGAVIAFCPRGPAQVRLLEDTCLEADFVVVLALVAPSVLRDEDLKTLQS